MAKEKKIVRVESTAKKEKVTLDKDGNIVKANRVESIPKEGALPRRIFAVICWILAIAAEVVAILNVTNKLALPDKFSQTVWLIGLIVVDLIFVLIGSMLWKKANHIDPASAKNPTKFWLWNNLGSIVSVIAFLPLIVLVFLDKDMDKKNKTIVGVVAIVALLIAGLSSYDWNPISSEQLEAAKAEILANGGYDTDKDTGEPIVYWVKNSKKYHIHSTCSAINRSNTSDTILAGTIEDAFQKGLTEPCRLCIKAMEKINQEKEANSKKVGE